MIPAPIRSASRPAARLESRPAPMLGLNTADPITSLKPGYALRLDDWIARTDGLHVRAGYEAIASGLGAVTALLPHPGGGVLGCTASAIYSGTTAVVSGLGGGEWQGGIIANAGGRHLVCCNGVDQPRRFDGATWAVSAITGVDASRFCAMAIHQDRAFFVERDSTDVWYLGRRAIKGAAHRLPLKPLMRAGGTITAIASRSADGGRNQNDELAIITSEGELIIYTGTNPENAKTWALAGVWSMAKPAGRRCFVDMGGSLAVLTVKGLLPVPRATAAPASAAPLEALSETIWPTICAATSASGATGCADSGTHELTVVQAGGQTFVRSSTGAWSLFTRLAATCWLAHGHELYFGTSTGKVCRYGGDTDAAAPIRSFAVEAFQRSPQRRQMKRIRPLYTLAHPYVPRIEMLADYRDPPASFEAANIDDAYWRWEDVSWNRMPMRWMREQSARLQPWRSVNGRGTAFAMMMSMQSMTPVIWTGSDVIYETGAMP